MTTSPLKVEDSRAQFEQFAAQRYGDVGLQIDEDTCDYLHEFVRAEWEAWTASRAAIVIEPPKAEFFLVWDGKKHSTTFTEATENYSAILRAAGITVKGDS
jgi:hypothetical protein